MSHAHSDHHADLKHADGSWKYTNALADETSPYLLQHAHNPVDWHAWGDKAFDLARQQNKPIFLSIGYSTCYWCHVMERQSFENPAIAKVMNEHFINIKVDREERPDVDDIYMTAVQVMTGHGGWPMSVFLTPPGAEGPEDRGLRPYYAGTYFPPTPSRGMPGFPQLLEALSDAYVSKRDDVLTQSKQIAHAVENHLGHRDTSGEVTVDLVQRVANQLVRNFDTEHGGFGGAPKFPQPGNLALLLTVHRNNPNPQLWQAIEHTLDRMARGGMYDQIGGGFHRYSTDAEWLVPHFEKMLYDNGQLLELYVDAHALQPPANDPTQYERVARETAEYVLREMTDDTGAFWSAQDAEVDAMEGGNYVWLPGQIDDAIADQKQAAATQILYGLDRGTNFRDPHHPDATPVNVIFQPVSLPAFAEANGVSLQDAIAMRDEVNAALLRVRDTRKQPGTDDKVLVSWNGLMIAGLAKAGQTFNEPRYIQAAGAAANAILQHMQVPASAGGGLFRSMRAGQVKIPAFLDDYAAFVHGLLALHEATSNARWLDEAVRLTGIARDRFAAPDGGYFDTLEGQADLFVRTRSTYDGAVPAGNSMMVNNLVSLYLATEDREFLQQAIDDLHSFGGVMREQGMGMVNMHRALLRTLELLPASGEVADIAKPGSKQKRDVLTVAVDPHEVTLGDDPVTLTIELRIGEEYHLNGPDAAAEGLIPTRVEVRGDEGIDWSVTYPPTVQRKYAFAEEKLEVFDGTVTIELTMRRTAPSTDKHVVVLSYQLCTEMSCLQPREAELPVEIR